MTMTLECETEFPKVLKDLMLIMGFEGPAVYWGFPFIDEEDKLEYWWVQIHLYRSKEYDHKMKGNCMFTNTIVYPSLLDSARCAAGMLLKNLQKDSSGDFTTLRKISRKPIRRLKLFRKKIGRASCRERVCLYV